MIDLLRSVVTEPVVAAPSFAFEVPLSFFSKAEDEVGQGKGRRIGGVMSSESVDRQGEVILQRGLDFDDFLANGWFNDNHSKKTDEILGYPDKVQQFARGQMLPDGSVAKTNCTWVEGYLLPNYPLADRIWQLGQSLQTTGRRLGFSVEGSILRRQGPGDNIIARAKVRNCAVTNCPVNTDSRLEILARSLAAIEAADSAAQKAEQVEKMLTVGGATTLPYGTPVTGAGAGRVLARQDIERPLRVTTYRAKDAEDDEDAEGAETLRKLRRTKKSLSGSEAVAWVQTRFPSLPQQAAVDFVRLTKTLARHGYL